MLDGDSSQRLSYEELRDGLVRLRVTPPIVLTEDDFDTITEVRVISSGREPHNDDA
jgi:hypothetical protein